jgi:NADP-dependent aldehyde dehydrogenase
MNDQRDADAIAARLAAALKADQVGLLEDPGARISLLQAMASRLEAGAERLIAEASRETGLGRPRLEGEMARTVSQLLAFANLVAVGDVADAMIDRADPSASPPQPELRRLNLPIGPVLVFTASNFPFAFGSAGGDVASALAAGCPVIVKDNPMHPETALQTGRLIAETAAELGLEGGFGHLLLAGEKQIYSLLDAPEVAAIAFTGSFAVGEQLLRAGAARQPPIPVYAEMGSLNPLVVTEAAAASRQAEIATGLATSLLGSAGQLCTKPGVVFVPSSPAGEQLVGALCERLSGWEPEPLLGSRIRARLRDGVEDLRSLPEVAVEGGQIPEDGALAPFTVARTDARSFAVNDRLKRELFGPAVLIVSYEGDEEVLGALESLQGQLTVTIHSEPDETVRVGRLLISARRLAGRVVFDGYPTGVRVSTAMMHGGPWPATSAAGETAVGMTAVRRFSRPVCFQDAPADLLPPELTDSNPLGIWRRIDGQPTRASLPADAEQSGERR